MSLTSHQNIISTQAETIADLQEQLNSFRESMVTIERMATHPLVERAILEVAKRALEIDKAHNSM